MRKDKKMSKTSSTPSQPAYSGGSVRINGNNIATVRKEGDNFVSDYNMSKIEKKIFDSVQSGLSDALENLFTVSDPQRQEWQKQLNTMQDTGLQNLNSIYGALQNSLKNDIASRFGNLDNSIFMDKLSSITDNKSKAVADLVNNLTLASNNLYNQEIQRRINTISLLNGLNNSINNNILSYLAIPSQNANSGNQFNKSQQSSNNQLGFDQMLSAAMFATSLF